jgi:hypothetical protein
MKPFEDAFFSRWEIIRALTFEMQILKDKGTIVAVEALYEDSGKKWAILGCSLNPFFHVFGSQESN